MNFDAAIFDMDGLLLDTERVCMRVFKQACVAQNVPFLEDVYLSIIGCNSAGIEKILRDGYGAGLDYPALHNEWKERYKAIVMHQAIPVKKGVVELLEWFKYHKIALAVATSSNQEVALTKLRLAKLDHYFSTITTGCEVKHGKPDPEIYLLAAERLAIEPSRCLAFEDSNNGTKAAIAANMETYQVPDLVKPSDEIIALGHEVYPSLSHVLQKLKGVLSLDLA
ncbi:HAD family hydrolase [Marinomonas sp. PE14-40]|uniref:HAD family hydrolase n=1 Tax=Marinomonas sp. PE14-40 TaxID=3060621 RepID=UPI003F663DF7